MRLIVAEALWRRSRHNGEEPDAALQRGAGVSARSLGDDLWPLIQVVESGIGVSTLCEVGRGMRLVAPAVEGIAACQVLAGTLYIYAGAA